MTIVETDQRSRLSRGATLVFHSAYSVVFVGFLFHRSNEPVFFTYSTGYLVFLGLLALPFLGPTLLRWVAGKIGVRNLMFSLTPVAGLLAVGYLVAHFYYDYTTTYPFDPFLQRASPVLEDTHTLAAEEGTFRILTLGGSTTLGSELAPSDKYPAVLESILNARTGRSVEVLNLGQNWYTTRHSISNYVTYGNMWEPDLIIVMHAINDISKSFSHPRWSIGPYNDRWTHHYAQGTDAAHARAFEASLLEPLRGRLSAWFSVLRLRDEDFPLSFYQSIVPFRRHLENLTHYARADGAQVMLLTQSSIYRDSMDPTELGVLFRGITHIEEVGFMVTGVPSTGSLARAMAAFNEVTKSVALEEGTLMVDLASGVPPTLEYHFDDVHHTAVGARRVAELIADEIISKGVLTRTPPGGP